ncbi:MFS transporter [Actinoplanes sp. NPDC026619]|uniref:MFS transporter n=1 Tax=Actinoplanes sp. NPDC026619 TaxID=3155798 RepID=UPI0033E34632
MTVLVMCFGAMMTFLQITTSAAALSAIQDDLLVGPATLVWIPSSYTLPVATFVLTAATLGNRFGRRRLFVAGVVVMMAGSLLLIAGGSLAAAIAGQFVAGVGGALILPNSLAILGDAFPDPHRRTEVITLWAASSGIGLAIGPVVAGALLEITSWHAVFLPTAALGAVTVAGARLWVPESRGPAARLDLPGVVLGTIAVAAPVYAAIEGDHLLAAVPVTILAVAGFIVVERRSPAPMLDLRLFRSASFAGVLVVAAIAMFGFTGVAIIEALFFERAQGLSALHMGYRLLVLFGVYIAAAGLAGPLVRHAGFKAPMAAGLVVAAGGCLGLMTQHAGTGFGSAWAYFAVLGAGCGLVVSPSTAAALAGVPAAQVGAASGIVNTIRQLGSVLGSALLGALLARRLLAELPGELAGRAVPAAVGDQVTAAVADGRSGGGQLPPAVRMAIGDAFVSGVNAVLVVTAIVFLLGAVVVLTLVRNRPHEEHRAPAARPDARSSTA